MAEGRASANNPNFVKVPTGKGYGAVDPTGEHGFYEGGVFPQDQRVANASRGAMLSKQLRANKSAGIKP